MIPWRVVKALVRSLIWLSRRRTEGLSPTTLKLPSRYSNTAATSYCCYYHQVTKNTDANIYFFCLALLLFQHLDKRWPQVGVVPFPPRYVPPVFFIAHSAQHSHCARRFYRMLLTHACSRFPRVNVCTTRKSPYGCVRVYALGRTRTHVMTYV